MTTEHLEIVETINFYEKAKKDTRRRIKGLTAALYILVIMVMFQLFITAFSIHQGHTIGSISGGIVTVFGLLILYSVYGVRKQSTHILRHWEQMEYGYRRLRVRIKEFEITIRKIEESDHV